MAITPEDPKKREKRLLKTINIGRVKNGLPKITVLPPKLAVPKIIGGTKTGEKTKTKG